MPLTLSPQESRLAIENWYIYRCWGVRKHVLRDRGVGGLMPARAFVPEHSARKENDLYENRKWSPSTSGLPLHVFGKGALDKFQKGG